ncbi:MAG: glycosyltransferase [Deltaproteobacteria bacterium]|nr:glycosyltransferase [Deltaproteobacteria bacterium]
MTSSFEYEDDEGIPTFRFTGWRWLPRLVRGDCLLWDRAARLLFQRYVDAFGTPDIIHAHSALFAGVTARRLRLAYGIPYVITEHSSVFATRRLKAWEVPQIERAFRCAEARIMVSPSLGHLLEGRFDGNVRPWIWIPNMVSNMFQPSPKRDRLEADRPFVFLNVGFLREGKGQGLLIDSFARVFQGEAGVGLRIVGDGGLREKLEAQAARLGVEDQVTFLGGLGREDVLRQMQACDAYVLSSDYETFGVVLVEALACGKPVVATACGGPECIVDETNGLLVPPGDVEAMASALREMRSRAHTYDPGAISRDCRSRFGAETVARELTAVYRDVILKR